MGDRTTDQVGLVSDLQEYADDPEWFNILFEAMGYPIPNRDKVREILDQIDDEI